MGFWKKLFGKGVEENMTDSHFDKYRNELGKLGLSTFSDLENLVKTQIKPTTKIKVSSSSRPPENSQLNSHFGGQPYFEKGEKWPTTKRVKNLDFIFQIYNSPDLQLPKSIELIQFYYDWDEFPWDTQNEGWLLKVYNCTKKENLGFIKKPSELEKSKYCAISFETTNTLPDWEGIDLHPAKCL